MFRLYSEKIIKRREKKWEKKRGLVERDQKLTADKELFFPKRKFLSASKLLILFLFLNCTLIEIFTGYITIQTLGLVAFTGAMPDFTPLVTLIGAAVSEVIGFAIYSLKSMKENTSGGIVYDATMKELDKEISNEVDENALG